MALFFSEPDGHLRNLKQELLQHSKELAKLRKSILALPEGSTERKKLQHEHDKVRMPAYRRCKKQLDVIYDIIKGFGV